MFSLSKQWQLILHITFKFETLIELPGVQDRDWCSNLVYVSAGKAKRNVLISKPLMSS